MADIFDDGKLAAIRNPDGIWINTETFRETGKHFEKYGYYTEAPELSPDWFDFWTQQREYCLHGYSSGGVRITGDHYNYLNFCPIQKVEDA